MHYWPCCRPLGDHVAGDNEFLVCYDYGMGGLWSVAKHRLEAAILRCIQGLNVNERPEWMDDEDLARMREIFLST